MRDHVSFLILLCVAILAGLVCGFRLKGALHGGTLLEARGTEYARPAPVSKKIGFTAHDAAGEISADISPFKSGISGTYVEVHLRNVTADRAVQVEYIKVAFFDEKGDFVDYGEGKLGKLLRPGDVMSAFLYMSKGNPPAFYNEGAKKADFDRIGPSEPYRKTSQQL
jgi:hypothetical protein